MVLVQPVLMFYLMSLILVHPTFTMYVEESSHPLQKQLISAMQAVGSPIGDPYIDIVFLPENAALTTQQAVSVIDAEKPLILQRFNLIDSNMVKNFRNRITAAGLLIWQDELGSLPVQIEQKPLLPHDLPYTLYFGLALLPMSAYLAAAMIGGLMMGLEFELNTVLEYRLSPFSALRVFLMRLLRLVLTAWLAASFVILGIGALTGN